MKESFNRKTDNRSENKLQQLHTDISSIKDKSVRGYRYFLLVIDDATRATWIRYLRDKSSSEVVREFKQLIVELQRAKDKKVTVVRCDNGKGEFGSEFQAYLKEEGIRIEPCPVYKHSMNGVAERTTGIIDKLARSMLY